jgi:tyrosyl-tRNA synthetase
VPSHALTSAAVGVQADICQLGMDQRKVNMLAREYCNDIKRKLKPVILSHRMMPGLLEVRCLPAAVTAAAREQH